MTKVVHTYRPYGAARDLFLCRDPEVLIEGPAGTGKTRAVLEYVNYLCENNDNIRVLMFRKTRASMTESVLVTYEDEVLWPGHPARTGEASRGVRPAVATA
jgi:phage terminase large subunit